MKWKPTIGEVFYTVKLTGDGKCSMCHWGDYPVENSMYDIGVVFKTREQAIAATELCLSALRGELVRKEDAIEAINSLRKDVIKILNELSTKDPENSVYQNDIEGAIKAVEEL